MALIFRSFIVLILCALPALAETIAGRAVVVDGDTLDIGAERVRLFGVDAPEHDQMCEHRGTAWPCGQAATQALAGLVGRGKVVCEVEDRDRYGRAVSTCMAGGADLAEALVRQGAAVAYRRYSLRYVAAEVEAKADRRGIWGGQMMQPEAFRHGTAQDAPVKGCTIKGNIGTHGRIYHLPGQMDYARTRINEGKGERWFCSEAEARAAGWRRAQH